MASKPMACLPATPTGGTRQTSSLRTQRATSSCSALPSSQTARRRLTLRQRRAQLVHTSSPSWTTQRGGAGARHRCALATSATAAPPAPRTHPRIRRGLGGHRPTSTLPPPCHHLLATTASPPPRPHRLAATPLPPHKFGSDEVTCKRVVGVDNSQQGLVGRRGILYYLSLC